MNSSRWQRAGAVLFTVVIVLSVATSGVTVGATATSTDEETITGSLSNADGTNVSGWKVLAGLNGSAISDRTDSNGNFALDLGTNDSENVPVWFQQFNHTLNETENFPRDGKVDLYALGTIDPGQGEDIGPETLPNGSLLNVQVVDGDGNPVPDSHVRFYHVRNGTKAPAEAMTDGEGYAVLDSSTTRGIEITGEVIVEARGPDGYGKNFSTIYVDQDRNYTVTLTESPNVTGQLTSAVGKPVANDSIVFKNQDSWQNTGTNATGNFGLALPADGTYKSVFYQDGSPDAAPADGIPDFYPIGSVSVINDTDLGTQELPTGHNLTVVVQRADGSTVSNATVGFSQRRDEAWAGQQIKSGSNGEATMELYGETHIYVTAPAGTNLADTQAEVTVTNDEVLTVTLAEEVAINGTVSDSNGDGASSVRVFYNNESHHYGTTTGGSGFYSTAVAANTTYEVDLTQEGLENQSNFPNDGVPGVYAYGEETVGDSAETNNYELPKGNDFNLTVVDPDGNPVSNVDVYLTHENGDTYATIQGVTNADGMFIPSGAAAPGIELNGSIHVGVQPGSDSPYTQVRASYDVTGPRSVTITVEEAVEVTGRVETASGLAVNDSRLNIRSLNESSSVHTGTADDGTFQDRVAQNSTHAIEFEQRNFEGEDFPKDGVPDIHDFGTFTTGTSNKSLGNLTLPEGHLLNVTVVDESGNPVENARVHVSVANAKSYAGTGGTTTSSGELLLEGAEETGIEVNGDVRVHVEPENEQYVETSREVTVTENRSIKIQLEPAMNISGQVIEPDGTPAVEERVEAHDPDSGAGDGNWTTTEGNFSLSVAESGTYEVEFSQVQDSDSFRASFPEDGVPDLYAIGEVDNSSNNLGTVQLPDPHNLTVEVVNESGDPVSDVEVNLIHQNNGVSSHGSMISDQNGSVSAELVGDVNIYVDASGTSYKSNSTQVTLTDDRTVKVVLTKGIPATGRLKYTDGTNVSGWHVNAFGQGGDSDQTSDDGTFTLHLESDKEYDLAYKQTDWGGGKVDFPKDGKPDLYVLDEFSVGSSQKDLGTREVPKGHLINITVTNQSGDPVSGLELDIWSINGSASGHHGGYTNANGEVVLDGAATPGIEANGTLRIRVEPTGTYAETSETFEVTSRQNATITVQQPANITGRLVHPDGNTSTNDSVVTFGSETSWGGHFDSDTTDENGEFKLTSPPGDHVDVQFYQGEYWVTGNDSDPIAPRDGIVDLYAVTQVNTTNGDVDIGNQTLPKGHVVNVTVLDESGDPVPNATLSFSHFNGPIDPDGDTGIDAGLSKIAVDSQGQLYWGNLSNKNYTTPPGIELAGNVTIEVTPPEDSDRFTQDTYKRNLTVESKRNITFTLDTRDTISGQFVDSSGKRLENDTLAINSEGSFNVAQSSNTGNFTVDAPDSGTYSITYAQRNNSVDKFFPRDGITDFYATSAVTVDNTNISVGQQTIPDSAGILNVKVVNESGASVENASINIRADMVEGGQKTGFVNNSSADGFYVVGGTRGIEANGSYVIVVEPPKNDSQYLNNTYTRNVTVTNDTLVTVTLDEPDAEFVVNHSVESERVRKGQPINATASVTNTGNATGTKRVTFTISNSSGNVRTVTREVSVDPGNTKTVQFSEVVATGSYDVTINDQEATIVSVADAVNVAVEASDPQIGVGQNTTVDIIVTNATEGVGSFSVTVSPENDSIASITDASVTVDGQDSVTIASDGSSATVEAYNTSTAQDGEITIATVRLNGTVVGDTPVRVSVDSVGSESGQTYYIEQTSNDSVTVVEVPAVGNFSHRPTDIDGDGTFEDVNGDGDFTLQDIDTLFRNSSGDVVTEYGDAFDFNGDGKFDIVDVQALYDEYQEANGGS